MTTLPTAHPFEMYSAIQSQPEQVARLALSQRDKIAEVAALVRAREVTTLVGIGSSLHAAQIGAALWREILPARRIRTAHSFDFSIEPETVGDDLSDQLVISFSHRGKKKFTLEALARAKEMGAKTCIITGEGIDVAADSADIHISTVKQERSSAHTVSLVGSVAIIASLVEMLAGQSSGRLMTSVRNAISNALGCEEMIRQLVSTLSPRIRHIWLVGAGSDVYVAKEIALKIKETSYIPAEGMSVEEMLHGPFQCVEPDDLMLLIDTQGLGTERIATLEAMSGVVGVPVIMVTASDLTTFSGTSPVIHVERNESRVVQSVGALVVLQLFTYLLSIARGTNPDGFRLEDPRFKEAMSLVRL